MASVKFLNTAIISVTDKTDLVMLGEELKENGVYILGSSGTVGELMKNKIEAQEIGEYTGSPEILDGRVKTIHPMIAGGILAKRDNPEHMTQLVSQGIRKIDLVVVNLYDFEQAMADGLPNPEILEKIDIGGVDLIRSAAKCYPDVIVLVDPTDYGPFISDLKKIKMTSGTGNFSEEQRRKYAQKAFKRIADYDLAISTWFNHARDND
ncbi:MAG: hypothetical protein V1838_01970 [Patescibacteria group bacterium]